MEFQLGTALEMAGQSKFILDHSENRTSSGMDKIYANKTARAYSHSIVPGGFEVMS
jgi:hypothetical protein